MLPGQLLMNTMHGGEDADPYKDWPKHLLQATAVARTCLHISLSLPPFMPRPSKLQPLIIDSGGQLGTSKLPRIQLSLPWHEIHDKLRKPALF